MKILAATMPIVVPQPAKIIRQGIAEGIYVVDYPEKCLEVAMCALERRVLAYERSMERVLGAAAGSITILPPAQLLI